MDKESIKLYRIDEPKETYLWENADFVFDSSALLDLYFSPKPEREKISEEIFKKLTGRLWLPFHVQYEYLKNREKTIKKPIKEKYEPLKVKIKKIENTVKSEVLKRVEEITRETSKGDKHPHLRQDLLDGFKKQIEDFIEQNKTFEKEILKEVSKVEKEIISVEDDDDVLKSLEAYFGVGREFTFDEVIEITKEGKHRYEFKIPPGYGDLNKKEKQGTQIFGDLIIWKQILEYSKERKKPIVFITNDIKKDNDWCYLDEKATESRIYSPREELIKEIKDHSSVDFWMYNLPQFLYQANKRINSSIQEETIQNLYQFINNKNSKSKYLSFKCSNCEEIHRYHESSINLDFDCVGGSERKMGAENQYLAEEYFKCDCGNDINVKFEVWEYPEGIHNYDSVKIDGAELMESFYFTVDFYDDMPDFITCHICDGNKEGMGNFVRFDRSLDLTNEFKPDDKPNGEYNSVTSGNCDWCNSLHIECPDCLSITLMDSHSYNENIECEGGCGLTFKIDTSNDIEGLGEFELKLVDLRIKECSSCGTEFVDKSNIEICEKCEEKYNEE
ncbi:PIN-like domain-containing protein [Winogradskyella sp.]|jgi:hypothetical protein|uniref:PIN-like domain-containing protein n=1 Tax=Winogradskyella sp. TaxID=1883156 RepID=UPI0025F00087|nr:PIN-like domain-containing protein [Winogradskyella sp.]MCT4629602.1 PIN domain-containing protein [Winogradskyella sp.]